MNYTAAAIEVMQAFLKGQVIEYRKRELNNAWIKYPGGEPSWDWSHCDYRIVVTLPKPREFWMNIYANSGTIGYVYSSRREADIARIEGFQECIKVREVLPE